MNRFREDTPYVFRPPKYSPGWARLIYLINDAYFLRHRHRVSEVAIAEGSANLLEKYQRGDSLLIAPNHSDHSDPHVFLHLSRRFRIPIHFMAAREIFELNRGLNGIALQRAGVFSIDREASDIRAVKEALKIAGEGRFPLVIFPEGEIYHLNSRLTPLNEGAATIILRAAKKIKKDGKGKRAFVVPTALRFTYADDISATFAESMDGLERHFLWKPQRKLDIVERIYKLGEAVLSLKEKEFLNRTLEGPLHARLHEFRELLVGQVESRLFSKVSEGNHAERVRRCRGKLRSILLAEERPAKEVVEECDDDLDRLYTAIQLYSYPGEYIRQRPTTDRIAETILKFEEDIFQENRIKGRRRVEVTFCPPIDAFEYLDAEDAAAEVTRRIEEAIKGVLESH